MKLTREYLQDLLDEIRLVENFSRDGEAVFLSDERTKYAVMMAYARIGEIVKPCQIKRGHGYLCRARCGRGAAI